MMDFKPLLNLKSLLNLSNQLKETYDLEVIFSSVLLSLMGKLMISKGCGVIRIENQLKLVTCKGINNLDYTDECFEKSELFYEINNSNPLYSKGLKFILKLVHNNKILGYIVLGDRLKKSSFTETDLQYIQLVASISASSIENALNINKIIQEKNTITKQNYLLKTYIEISNDFKKTATIEEISRLFSLFLKGNLLVNKIALYIKEDDNYSELINTFKKKLTNFEINNLLAYSEYTYVDDLFPELSKSLINKEIELIYPIMYNDKSYGLLLIGNKLDNQKFDENNFALLELLTNTLVIALENFRLFQKEIEKKKLESELQLALDIQKQLLPKNSIYHNDYQIIGMSKPSKTVGGDYFDYFPITQDEIMVVIADISGKGMPAALLMSNLQASIRSLSQMNIELPQMVKSVNSLLYNNTAPDKFATLFVGKIDTKKHKFEYINAGHNPPIHINCKNEIKELSEGGIMLGILEKTPEFKVGSLNFSDNDVLLLYTDGVNESIDENGNEYGMVRLNNLLKSAKSKNASSILTEVYSSVEHFSKNTDQYDDITAILIKKEKTNVS